MKKTVIILAAMAALAPAAHAADKPDCDSGRTPDIVACVNIETAYGTSA